MRLILIGLSTGGPSQLHDLLSVYRAESKDRIVICQHMPYGTTAPYAERVSQSVGLPYRIAVTGDKLLDHPLIVCPGEHHLSFSQDSRGDAYCRVTQNKLGYLFQPSIDLFLSSALSVAGTEIFVVILTGMGSDGSEGLKVIKQRPCTVLAQKPDEAVAPGMPSSSIQTGLVDHILSLRDIGLFLNSQKGTSQGRAS